VQLAVVDEEIAVVCEPRGLRVEGLGRVVEHVAPLVHRLQSHAVEPVEILVGGHEIPVFCRTARGGAPDESRLSLEIGARELVVVVVEALLRAVDEHEVRGEHLDGGLAVFLREQVQAPLFALLVHHEVRSRGVDILPHARHAVFGHEVDEVGAGLQGHHIVELACTRNGVGRRIDHRVAHLLGLVAVIVCLHREPSVSQPFGVGVDHVAVVRDGVAHVELAEEHALVGCLHGVKLDDAGLLVAEVGVVAVVGGTRGEQRHGRHGQPP